jgi:hypothetical protein
MMGFHLYGDIVFATMKADHVDIELLDRGIALQKIRAFFQQGCLPGLGFAGGRHTDFALLAHGCSFTNGRQKNARVP